ncbi:adiponectin receptor protein [Anaeramoeba ignava]|uniref:Adiponectin receptor protein n=1 Tax=Anaeramoeba ignava TaxID=1746090 RepID=A0A9Q0R896_ANAIG|nr:adiponectin receptor protein [Anaeramoeba ignava]
MNSVKERSKNKKTQKQKEKEKEKEKNEDKLRLYSITEIAEQRRGNKFLEKGYRNNYTFKMSIQSIFTIHNETVNIWSTFVPIFFIIWWAIRVYSDEKIQKSSQTAKIIFAFFVFGCLICLVSSTLFHVFEAHSRLVTSVLLKFDLSGIVFMMVSSFYPPIYFYYYPYKIVRFFYLSTISSLGILMLLSIAGFDFLEKRRMIRTWIFVFMGASGLAPLFHSIFLLPKPVYIDLIVRVMIMFVLYLIGVIFYASKIPERFSSPNRFVFWATSHQFWHLFVVVAMFEHFLTCARSYNYYLLNYI